MDTEPAVAPHLVVVSPHLDDAALSATSRLYHANATVVTVFTGLPDADLGVTRWDALTGAASSVERQGARILEDRAAMAILGAEPIHIGALEQQYRKGAEVDREALVRRLAALIDAETELWLPAGIGGHPDHAVVSDAGISAARDRGCRTVTLYADFPYIAFYGWPHWVHQRPADPFLDPDRWLELQLAGRGYPAHSLVPRVVELSDPVRAVKRRVVAAYASQRAALRLRDRDLDAYPELLAKELAWMYELTEDAAGQPGAATGTGTIGSRA